MIDKFDKKSARSRRHIRIRAKISGTAKVPRLTVFRSNSHIYAQLINDDKQHTVVSSSDIKLNNNDLKEASAELVKNLKIDKPSIRQAASYHVGLRLAQEAKKVKLSKAVFDRSGYKYHGLVKLVAQGARAGGLDF